ncbi:MAG TPA: glycosyltransferase [Acidimicrobiales bacterium]
MQPQVLFVLWDGGGNVNPVLALGRRLTARGIEVAAYGPPPLAGRFGAAGLAYVPRDVPDAWDLGAMARDVRDVCERLDVALAVVDYMLPGALVGAELAGRRRVALVHTLYGALLADGAPNPMGMAAPVGGVNGARAALGLAPVTRLADLLDACETVLVTCPAALDEREDEWAPNVRHVGPVLEDAGPDAGWRPPEGEGPLVVASMGTTPMGEGPVLARLLDALADEPVRVLVLLGDHLDRGRLRLPANATESGYVRHAAVLPHAALSVNHAGLGTVLAALAQGVPQVCLPLGREQPDNARAVERVGAGRMLAPDAGPEALRDAVRDVLAGEGYRASAERMAGLIAASADAGSAESAIASLLAG